MLQRCIPVPLFGLAPMQMQQRGLFVPADSAQSALEHTYILIMGQCVRTGLLHWRPVHAV